MEGPQGAGGRESRMAGDWIKMRLDLPDDPAVISIAAALGISQDEVVGKLHRLWSWADRHTSDGSAPGITPNWIDRFLSKEGFADAMVANKWLRFSAAGVKFPHFDRHNGESAKVRTANTIRQRRSRATKARQPRDQNREQNRTEESEKIPVSVLPLDSFTSRKEHAHFLEDPRASQVCEMAAVLFKKIDYREHDGGFLWQVAWLATYTKIKPADAIEAAQSTREKADCHPVKYFRGVLATRLGGGDNLKLLLSLAPQPRSFPSGAPTGTFDFSRQPK